MQESKQNAEEIALLGFLGALKDVESLDGGAPTVNLQLL